MNSTVVNTKEYKDMKVKADIFDELLKGEDKELLMRTFKRKRDEI